jgi:hypothetical protein
MNTMIVIFNHERNVCHEQNVCREDHHRLVVQHHRSLIDHERNLLNKLYKKTQS